MNSYEMMLHDLSDDQAVELALEVQKDIHRRDPIVQRLAQKVVADQKEFHQIALKSFEEELQKEKKALAEAMQLEAREDIQRRHAAGELHLFTEDEAKQKIEEAKARALAEFFAELEKPPNGTEIIRIQIAGDVITGEYKVGDRLLRMQHINGLPQKAQFIRTLKNLCDLP